MRFQVRKAKIIVVAFILVAACLSVAHAERWNWAGNKVSGTVNIKTFGSVSMAAVEEIAAGLGYRTKLDKNELVITGSPGLRFVHGAAAVWLGYNVIALPSRTRVEQGHWWVDTDSVLKVFSQFLQRNGQNQILHWAGAGIPQKREAAPSSEKKALNQPMVIQGSELPVLKSLRWGGESQTVRAVIDLIGEAEPLVSSEGERSVVSLARIDTSLTSTLSHERDGIVTSVKNGSVAKLEFSYPGRSVRIFTLKSPHRLVLDFKRLPRASAPPDISSDEATNERNGRQKQPDKKPSVNAPKKNTLVVVDAGHGGKDPGAMAHGYREKDIALQIAARVSAQLRERGVKVKMTRDGDTYPTLRQRTEMANRWKADVFISIHLNALPKGRHSHGVEIYIMALPTDKDAMELAKIENAEIADQNEGGKSRKKTDKRTEMLLSILGNMQQNAKITESTLLAEDLFKSGQESNLDMRRVAQAPFWVLRGAAMPAVLIETGFITELSEVKKLAQPVYQQRMAEAIADGIIGFIGR